MILELISTVTSQSAGQVFDGAKDVSFSPVSPNVLWFNAFGTVGAIIVAGLSLMSSLVNQKKIQEVHVLVNSQFAEYKEKVAQILALEKAASRTEGRDAERDKKN